MKRDVAIVTGAATGIGLATAKLLGKKYLVAATWRSTPLAAADLEAIGGVGVQCDVGVYEDCHRLVEEAQKHGRVTALVHCAALNPTPAPSVEEMEPEFWDRILRNNLTSSFYLAKCVLPAFRAAGGGAIVFVSSTAGRNGFSTAGGAPGHAKTAYATSKAGIIAFTKGLAREVAADHIRVNCMAAGPIDTRMLPNREATEKRVPMGRIGTAEEAAVAIAFLLDDATYTTGCTLDVCGGQYMN
ncbi:MULTISPECIES: SDR family oxidoreductase [unclassified Desulfovibrio]|uniref:SDR family NAD(P)-dependent oxidoreductase n=1 Tax=unclassified Desulfovibrio TaxID=2593640 RepID=UPI0013ED51BD|nr:MULTISPECIES: SDR family oxidoreductase [unclassified Desulfovibrio]